MEKKENLEIEKTPETLTKQDLEKVSGGFDSCISIVPNIGCFSD